MHPRRSVGDRHRAQSVKFMRLADRDPERAVPNRAWAEQHAREAVLHDFTDERNWLHLLELKVRFRDEVGVRKVLEDVFIVLGRDPDLLDRLNDVDVLRHGPDLLHGAFQADPMDPDRWWERVSQSDDWGDELRNRIMRLDLRDLRASLIFGRRLERILAAGHEDVFVDLAPRLLAHRPSNFELWLTLGRLHERREDHASAWSCYDHADAVRPDLEARTAYRTRLERRFDGPPPEAPDARLRIRFDERMAALAEVTQEATSDEPEPPSAPNGPEEDDLMARLAEGDVNSVFFKARSLVANGQAWAESYLAEAKEAMK